jgi:hypothetical protein
VRIEDVGAGRVVLPGLLSGTTTSGQFSFLASEKSSADFAAALRTENQKLELGPSAQKASCAAFGVPGISVMRRVKGRPLGVREQAKSEAFLSEPPADVLL